MKESCSVSVEFVAATGAELEAISAFVGVGPTAIRRSAEASRTWSLSVKGPSPVNAGRVANDLARELLARVGAAGRSREAWSAMRRAHGTRVTFHFATPRLLNFSYELDHDVLRGLADLHAPIVFYHHQDARDRTPAHRFGSGASPDEGCEASFRVSGENLDPEVVTRVLAREPASQGRRGEPITPGSSKVHAKGWWLLDGPSRSAEADGPIVELLAGLPTTSEAWTTSMRDHEIRILISFRVRSMVGHFDLESATLSALASSGCGLDASFYDWGPAGADLL